MRVALVNLPWASLDVPSLALGILQRSVSEAIPDAQVDVLHANLDYVDWVTERTEFSLADYQYYSLDSYFLGCGDWIFSAALYGNSSSATDRFNLYLAGRANEKRIVVNRVLRELATDFISTLAETIVSTSPDVVGLTSTFQQNTAALATAAAIKRMSPDTIVAMGGANCDGTQGQALHRNFSDLDFVVRGEGDRTFTQLLACLREGKEPAHVAGLCWRDRTGASVANPMSTTPLPPSAISMPTFDGYFKRLKSSKARQWVEPKLVVEGARGCWWGQKHHCTFCGLNGSFMAFRSKSPSKLFDEIHALVSRHQVLDIFLVDNILDMGYLTTLLPRLSEAGYDLRMQVEIKSNLRKDQLGSLRDAGLVSAQPGIENLSSRVLKIMDKGVTGCQNVRLLRDADAVDITVLWNYLYGFPGETAEDYRAVIRQMPALHHLTPPSGCARIAIERFSPYFDRPDLGFSDLRPAQQYDLIYQLPRVEQYDLAYIFEAPEHGIDEDLADRLRDEVTRWERAYPSSRLTYHDLGHEILLTSRRSGFNWTSMLIHDTRAVRIFRLLEQPRTMASILRAEPDSHSAEVDAILRTWLEAGVVFTDCGQYIHLACESTNSELLRIHHRAPLADQTGDETSSAAMAVAVETS